MEAEKELTQLYEDLYMLKNMTDKEACDYFNVDFKHEAEESITDEIAYYERQIKKADNEDVENDRQIICESVGLTRYPMMGYL